MVGAEAGVFVGRPLGTSYVFEYRVTLAEYQAGTVRCEYFHCR